MIPGDIIGLFREKPLLLYAPLDWGLGHTTRSIPLLRQLLAAGCRIIVACTPQQRTILAAELSDLSYVNLFGYDINYSVSRLATRLKLLAQGPKILTKIKAEQDWLVQFLAENRVDGVISDNRYGLYSAKVPSVIITHQLNVVTGAGSIVDRLLQKFIYRLLNRFTQCWVPDERENGLAGKLSHPKIFPSVPVEYIGWLSRMSPCAAVSPKYKYCFLLSGPEPQRTLLEKNIVDHLPEQSVLVRGLPQENATLPVNATVYNYADAKLLNRIICESETIVCRPGYTSMMELISMKKDIIVIPTPGQTEQEYLAKYLVEKKFVRSISSLPFE